MLNVFSRCATEKDCISNSCSDGVRGTKQDQWSCQAVLSSAANLVISSPHMYTRLTVKLAEKHMRAYQIYATGIFLGILLMLLFVLLVLCSSS